MRKEEIEEQSNKEAKEGWRFAPAARITDERAGIEDQKHTSGGVFVAVDSNLVAVVGEKEGAVTSIPGNEGRITQAWVNVRRGIKVFALILGRMKRARVTKHPWLVACDANMSPVDFEKKPLVSEKPDACDSSKESFYVQVKSASVEWVEQVYDLYRGRTKWSPLWWKEERRYRNGTSRSCRSVAWSVEEGCQEEGEVDER